MNGGSVLSAIPNRQRCRGPPSPQSKTSEHTSSYATTRITPRDRLGRNKDRPHLVSPATLDGYSALCPIVCLPASILRVWVYPMLCPCEVACPPEACPNEVLRLSMTVLRPRHDQGGQRLRPDWHLTGWRHVQGSKLRCVEGQPRAPRISEPGNRCGCHPASACAPCPPSRPINRSYWMDAAPGPSFFHRRLIQCSGRLNICRTTRTSLPRYPHQFFFQMDSGNSSAREDFVAELPRHRS